MVEMDRRTRRVKRPSNCATACSSSAKLAVMAVKESAMVRSSPSCEHTVR